MVNSTDIKKMMKKTGTTIVGVTCREGVVLAADTRATANFVAEKNCDKIHYIEPNVRCCGAGTAADNEYFTSKLIRKIKCIIRIIKKKHRKRN